MEREIAELRRRLADAENAQAAAFDTTASEELNNQSSEDVFYDPHSPPPSRAQSLAVSVDKRASPARPAPSEAILPNGLSSGDVWTLEDITLSKARVARLFEQ